ncbi:hypothetical protein HMPREF3033_00975 [Veillonellaceae bacterium DNF00751]|nr:hypothetical protein HMPREF3033_00975 [Veillonellaceae bacterium DNF00751]
MKYRFSYIFILNLFSVYIFFFNYFHFFIIICYYYLVIFRVFLTVSARRTFFLLISHSIQTVFS